MLKKLVSIYFILLLTLSFKLAATQPSYDGGNYEDNYSNEELFNPLGDKDKMFEQVFLEDTPINRIYAVRLLLNSPEYFPQGITYLNQIIRRGGFTPSALRNLKDASRILREYDMVSISKWFNMITGQAKIVEKRAFIVAQYFLNEAIMNSRIRLNISSVNEKVFVKTLLESYFLPLAGKNVRIVFPKKEEFAFTKWQIVEDILTDTLMLNSSEVDKLEIVRGEKPFYKNLKNFILEALGKAIDESEFNDVVEKGMKEIGINIAPSEPQPETEPETKSLVTDVVSVGVNAVSPLTAEQRKQLYKLIYNLYKGYVTSENIPVETYNDTLKYSLLMQLIADPGSVAVDPQLRTFAEKTKIEFVLGNESQSSFDELLYALQNLSNQDKTESCAKLLENKEVVFDLNCLYKKSSSGVGMNRKSINQIIIGMKNKQDNVSSAFDASQPVVRFVTSLGGEDMERLKTFLMIAKLNIAKGMGEPVLVKLPSLLWESLIKAFDTSKHKPVKFIADAAKFFNKAPDASAKVYDQIKSLYEKITFKEKRVTLVKNTVGEKAYDKYFGKSVKEGSRLESLFSKLVAVAVVAEVAAFITDMNILESMDEKRDSISRHGGNLIALRLYYRNVYGTFLASWDLIASTCKWLGMPNTPYSYDVFAGAINYMTAWFNGSTTPTNLKIEEIENAYGLPLKPITLENIVKNIEGEIDLDKIFMQSNREVTNGIGRMIATIYFTHRSVDENTVDTYLNSSFGKKLGQYQNDYSVFMKSYSTTLTKATEQYKPIINNVSEEAE